MIRKVQINDRVYEMKYTLKIFFIYEGIVGKPFDGKRMIDSYILCYSCLLACNPDSFDMTFDDFIEYCSEDQTVITEFNGMLADKARINNQMEDSKKKD